MRQDQIARLNDLADRLAETFLTEADPDNWSGAGKLPADMTKTERGDRHWDRKGAMGTGGVLRYTLDLIAGGKANAINDDGEQTSRDADLESRVQDAERRAHAAMKRALDPIARAKFSKAAHGRQG